MCICPTLLVYMISDFHCNKFYCEKHRLKQKAKSYIRLLQELHYKRLLTNIILESFTQHVEVDGEDKLHRV